MFQARACAAFRPCIDIHRGVVKQIVGGTLKGGLKENFVADMASSHFSRLYAADNLTGGHVIMLDDDDSSWASAREAVVAYPGGLQVGGGVCVANAKSWLDAGATHVIVTSFVLVDGFLREDRLQSLVRAVGKDHLVLDLSCRKQPDGRYYVASDRWQKLSGLRVDEATLAKLAASCDEFLVHGVDVEGLRLGVDLELVRLLGMISPIPVTYAGGVRSLHDLDLVDDAGGGRVDVSVGSALDIFGGELAYTDAVVWHTCDCAQRGRKIPG